MTHDSLAEKKIYSKLQSTSCGFQLMTVTSGIVNASKFFLYGVKNWLLSMFSFPVMIL